MTTDTTLFGHVTPMFTNQMERVATEALAYILSESEAARQEVARMATRGGAGTFKITHVETEVEVEANARVDLIGFDRVGTKRLLVEAKFDAALTANQPNTYLAALPPDGPSALLFIVPSGRLESLWPEVRKLAAAKYRLTPDLESGNLRSASLEGGDGRHLMMTDWSNIIDIVHKAAVSDGDVKTKFETAQLQGLVNDMENETAIFLPLTPREIEPDIPRRMLSLMRLVDDAVARAQASGINVESAKPRTAGRRIWKVCAFEWPARVVRHLPQAVGHARDVTTVAMALGAVCPQSIASLVR